MRSAQFYKGIINGVADTYESADLLQVLPSDKLNELWDNERLGVHNRVFLAERVIAKTIVSKSEPDELGRDGTVNYTVLYRFDATVEHDGVRYHFPDEQFAKDARAGKYKGILMSSAPTLKRPLDAPPALELM